MAVAEEDLAVSARASTSRSDVQSFDDTYKALEPGVSRIIARYIKDRARVEDLVQETFLRAERLWDADDRPADAWPLVRTIAERICIDAWRSEEAGPEVSVEEPQRFDGLIEEGSDPHDRYAERLRAQSIGEVLGEMDPDQRRVLLLKDLEGCRYSEIAQMEGLRVGALRSAVSRSRKRFRRRYLDLARERGLPALAPAGLLGHLRVWRRRSAEAVGGWVRQVQALPLDTVGAAGAAQISNALIALALVVAGTVAGDAQGARLVESPVPASSGSAVEGQAEVAVALPHAEVSVSGVAVEPSEVAAEEEDGGRRGLLSSSGERPSPVVPEPPPQANPENVTNPNRNVASPEDVRVTSIEFSPAGDGTIYMAGHNRDCPAAPPVCSALLFRSTDSGASWERLEAAGFDGTTVLLPPAHGAGDDRIFAMSTSEGLQVSEDDGVTFRPAAPGASAAVGSATISPGFSSGDPRIIIGTSRNLMQYRDDNKSITPTTYSAAGGRLEPSFAARGLLLVGGRAPDQAGQLRTAVFRCDGSLCSGGPISDGLMVPSVRVAPDFAETGTVHAFTTQRVFLSTDGGRTFEPRQAPHDEGHIVDMSLGRASSSLFAAVQSFDDAGSQGGLYVSKDGGFSWERISDPLLQRSVIHVRHSAGRVLAALADGGLACSGDDGGSWRVRC